MKEFMYVFQISKLITFEVIFTPSAPTPRRTSQPLRMSSAEAS